jgi:hypothetical protein
LGIISPGGSMGCMLPVVVRLRCVEGRST